MSQPLSWKKGRGKLGLFAPLLGRWRAEEDSPLGRIIVTRTFTPTLDKAYIRLDVDWAYPDDPDRTYQELALIGVGPEGEINFWSFTSDKKQSQGTLADVSELHPQAIGFHANMPAGLARMAYYPGDQAGFHWTVEAQTQKGWRQITSHHYLPTD